ncbi:MAG: PEP-CTERM sorting domain-containing protein [Akkermansiaceae bacterium]
MSLLIPPVTMRCISRAALCMLALIWSYTAADAVITVDGDNPEYRDNQNGYDAIYSIYDEKKSSASFIGETFLKTDAAGSSVNITAYNDGNSTNNADNSYASIYSSFTLSDAGLLLYGEGSEADYYVPFYLSANQQGNADSNFYGLDGLEIYTSEKATVDNIAEARTGNLAYKFDSSRNDEGNGTGQLELFYGSGNSNWDVVLFVPLSAFTLENSDREQTYVQFVVDTYTDTAGSDSWQYDSTLIPEPSSSLLISLGGVLGLMRRRR